MTRETKFKKEQARLLSPMLFVTGMQKEAACFAHEGVETLCSSANVSKLCAALEDIQDIKLSAVISIGLAGGLDPSLRPGDVVIADAVINDGIRLPTHARLFEALTDAVSATGDKFYKGALIGVDHVVLDTQTKKHLFATTQARAVDMESHVAEKFARAKQLPFGALRVISDPATRTLPPLVTKAITANGDVNIAHILKELLRAPDQIQGLILAGLDSRAAFASLRRSGALLGPLLRLMLTDL